MAKLTVLGVEATGGGTQAVVMHDGEQVRRFTEGPLNVMLNDDALDRLTAMIREAQVDAAGLGLAGIANERDAQLIEMQLRAKTGVPVTVGDDTEIAQLGAFNGAPGIVVIAHAGSNSFGRAADGRAARVGGHGYVVGDEGSYYWVASRAIRAALVSHDGRGPKSSGLERALNQAYGMSFDGVVRRVTGSSNEPSHVTKFAKAAMAVDDAVMRGILQQAADDLVAHVSALRARLGKLPVGMYGSMFENPVVRQRFVAATGAVDAASPPVVGAAVLAEMGVASRGHGGGRSRDMGYGAAA